MFVKEEKAYVIALGFYINNISFVYISTMILLLFSHDMSGLPTNNVVFFKFNKTLSSSDNNVT